MSFHSYAHSILWFTKKLASNSSAGGGSPTSFFNSNYLFYLSELQCTDSSPISNCPCLKSAILFSRNINYKINTLLQLHVQMHIIYIQTCQLSRFGRETHDFKQILTISRPSLLFTRSSRSTTLSSEILSMFLPPKVD